jgi:hypothetical protein
MGQYYVLVNYDQKQYVNPDMLGSGIKLWETTASNLPRIMPYLLQDTDSSGGGDPRVRLSYHGTANSDYMDTEKKLRAERHLTDIKYGLRGSWAGDRVSFLGDYRDTIQHSDEFDTLYSEVYGSDDWTNISRRIAQEVNEFIGSESRFSDMRVEEPADPSECDHDDDHDLFVTKHADDDDIYGTWKCRNCYDSGVLESRDDHQELMYS